MSLRQIMSLLVSMAAVSCTASAASPANTIGVYFDRDGLMNCIVGSTTHGSPTTAYIIARNLNRPLIAWNARLEVSPSSETRLKLPDGAWNSSEFPELGIQLAETLTGPGPHVLAEISLTSMEQLSIYLKPSLSHAIPETPAPVFYSMGSYESFMYEYGSNMTPVAVFGRRVECPPPNVDARPLPEKVEPQRIQPQLTGSYHIYSDGPGYLLTGPTPFKNFELSVAYSSLIGQPLCFVGALVDIKREALRFVDDKLSVAGYAYATFRVDEMLWGGSGEEYQIYVRGVDVPGVVEYKLGYRSVPISESTIGSKSLLSQR